MPVDVGYVFPTTSFYVDRGRVEEFVIAMGVDPVEGYTAEVGAPVPLGFLMYVTTIGADIVHDALDLRIERAVYGGADYEVHAPVRIGDTLEVQTEYSGRRKKDGARGALVFHEVTCDYFFEDGTLALRERSTTIERGT